MKGDFTRSTFRPGKHYSGVRMQQGRVQLDADWNEQADITTHRIETETGDVIGGCGAPMHAAGFALTGAAVPVIGEGRYYVDGILCENEADVALDQQPDLPVAKLADLITPTSETVKAGFYLAYLDVWQRHITALEDDEIREVALGGPDTATRAKTIWQVKLLGPLPGSPTCKDNPKLWNALLDNAQNGKLSARAEESATDEGPCVVPPGAGYRRLENQLYRVEIHAVDDATGAIKLLKWSRDNGAIVTRWVNQEGNDLIVSSIGRDDVLRFGPGQYVEVSDDQRELRGEAGILVKLSNAEGQVLALDATDPNAATVNKADFPDVLGDRPNNPKARRWDGIRQDPATGSWFELEDGVQVRFEAGRYHVGDYWLIPARTAKADVEWPRDTATPPNPIPQPRAGIEHHYCKLAILRRTGNNFTLIQDCRELFPPVTELTTLLYVGGDGQAAPAGQPLPYPLRVRVVNGQAPVIGAQVQFTKFGDGNTVVEPVVATSGPDGIAEYAWTLGTAGPQEVVAQLLDAGGGPVPGQLVRFAATVSVAGQGGGCCITVGKDGQYPDLDEALKDLLGRGERDICLCLLPGDSPLSFPEVRRSPREPDLNIKIVGAGMGSRVHLEKPILFSGVSAVTLHDFTLLVAFEAEGEQGAIAFDECGQVSLTGCHITGRTVTGDQIAGGALMSVGNTASARLRDMRLEAWTGPTFEVLLNALRAVEAKVLFDAMGFAEAGGPKFRDATLEAGATIAGLDDAGRKLLGTQLKRLSGQAELSDAERFNFQKMMTAVTNPGRPAEDYAAVIVDMRRAAIKARPGVALVLGALPDITKADVLTKLPFGVMDRDNFISIESSEISGEVGLYGLPVTPNAFAQRLPDGFLADFQGLMKAGRFLLGDGSLPLGTLEMRGNQMLRISLPMRMVDAFAKLFDVDTLLGFFNELLLTDNVFEQFPVTAAALHCGLANNQFLTGRDRAVGVVVSQSSAYTGNRGEGSTLWSITQFRGDAANVRIQIN